MLPTAADVARFLGREGDQNATDLATEHLPIITAMIRRYVREAGFIDGIPDNALVAVIVTSTARYVSNPSGTISETVGPFSVRQGIFNEWTLPELPILHAYRRRAA